MDTKQLKVLLKTLRDNGVLRFKTADIELELSPEGLFPEKRVEAQNEAPESPLEGFPEGILTQEQLMFYSAGGLPENDPTINSGHMTNKSGN